MNYSLFKWSRKTCSGHDSNAAILQASREYVAEEDSNIFGVYHLPRMNRRGRGCKKPSKCQNTGGAKHPP